MLANQEKSWSDLNREERHIEQEKLHYGFLLSFPIFINFFYTMINSSYPASAINSTESLVLVYSWFSDVIVKQILNTISFHM